MHDQHNETALDSPSWSGPSRDHATTLAGSRHKGEVASRKLERLVLYSLRMMLRGVPKGSMTSQTFPCNSPHRTVWVTTVVQGGARGMPMGEPTSQRARSS
jgi:hypothetical protein